MNIAIIGGGYAGMAAAVALAERGIPVTLFESARQLGGRARGVLHQDTQLDNGQHLLLGCYRQTLNLIEQVGGNLEQDFLRLPLQLDLHGQFALRAPRLPAPFHLLVALLRAQGISWTERLSAARFMLTLRRMNFKLPSPINGRGDGGEGSDMTVTELLARYQQNPALVQKLWEPLCIAALNTPVHKASAQVLLNVLRDALHQKRADSDMLLPRIDFTTLFPLRAANYVVQRGGRVLTSCGVEALRTLEHGMEITTAQACPEQSRRGSSVFSHVICALPPVTAAKLLRPIAGLAPVIAQIEALQQQPIYTVYLQYPTHVRLPQPMLGLHQRFSQWLFDKGQIAGQHGLIASVISAEGLHQQLSRDELAQKVIAELTDEFGITDSPTWYKVIAEKRATFACTPDLQRPGQQTPLPRLLLAGDYTKGDYPATLEGAVQSGLRCAAALLQSTKS